MRFYLFGNRIMKHKIKHFNPKNNKLCFCENAKQNFKVAASMYPLNSFSLI